MGLGTRAHDIDANTTNADCLQFFRERIGNQCAVRANDGHHFARATFQDLQKVWAEERLTTLNVNANKIVRDEIVDKFTPFLGAKLRFCVNLAAVTVAPAAFQIACVGYGNRDLWRGNVSRHDRRPSTLPFGETSVSILQMTLCVPQQLATRRRSHVEVSSRFGSSSS